MYMSMYCPHIFLMNNFISISITIFYFIKYILYKQTGIVENYHFTYFKSTVGVHSSYLFSIKLRTSKRANKKAQRIPPS